MKLIVVFLVFLLGNFVHSQEDGDLWVVLIAGSNTYSNYRHQADICQAYQQFHQAGVPDERIIVWMYDDIAHYWRNPHKGKIINYKGGPDVYSGVPKDYTGKTITPANFLKFLKGENMTIGSKKSLLSNENDRIFIYFSDHGGPGVICMPGMVELHVKDLMDAFQTMYDKKMYKEMVFYMEACESGSMFSGFSVEKWNIMAVTASNPHQSSYACDHDIAIGAYLNDCWSRDWLNDTRWALNNEKLNERTLEEQFQWVKVQSTQSPECRYGKEDYAKYVLARFQGVEKSGNEVKRKFPLGMKSEERTSAYEVPLKLLEKELEANISPERKSEVLLELKKQKRNIIQKDAIWNAFKQRMNLYDDLNVKDDTCNSETKFPIDCMKDAVITAKKHCGCFDDYSFKYYKYLYQACIQDISIIEMENIFKQIC